MRNHWYVWLLVIVFGALCTASPQGGTAAGEKFVGAWTGTWTAEGASGGIELILDKGTEGAVGGRVSVTGEPTYQATLKTVVFSGAKMTAQYDFPDDPSIEVSLTATFDGDSAKGTWAARQKDGNSEVASGTWSAARKP